MADRFLDKVYSARTSDETREIYDAWSKSYEDEVAQNGYVTPGRCADALVQVLTDKDSPILDFGCGTGLSGLALRAAGFTTLDGVDLSEGMLEVARGKGAYRSLSLIGPEDPVPSGYNTIAAIGVIGAGAAPLPILDRILEQLPKGGFAVFSFNDHTLQDPSYSAKITELKQTGVVIERFCEHGPHLPGREMGSNVYGLEKA